MPRLRMKDTPQDIEGILRSERRQRKKQRRAASTSNVELPPPDLGRDESAASAYQRMDEEDEFNEKLRSAMEEDQGCGFYEERMMSSSSAAFSYGGAAGSVIGLELERGYGGLDSLDEEEYAEYIRAQMWKRNHRDEVNRMEQVERQRKMKEEKERIENELRRSAERERIKRLEEKVKRRGQKEESDARQRYEVMWKKILSIPAAPTAPIPIPEDEEAFEGPIPAPPHPFPLRYTDFPWPLYPPAPFPPLSWPTPADITSSAVSNFLLGHLSSASSDAATKKAIIRSAVLAYHPDRFDRLLLRIPSEKEEVAERVKELGLRVSQVLNDLMKNAGVK